MHWILIWPDTRPAGYLTKLKAGYWISSQISGAGQIPHYVSFPEPEAPYFSFPEQEPQDLIPVFKPEDKSWSPIYVTVSSHSRNYIPFPSQSQSSITFAYQSRIIIMRLYNPGIVNMKK
jgi:hypothetical protein